MTFHYLKFKNYVWDPCCHLIDPISPKPGGSSDIHQHSYVLSVHSSTIFTDLLSSYYHKVGIFGCKNVNLQAVNLWKVGTEIAIFFLYRNPQIYRLHTNLIKYIKFHRVYHFKITDFNQV
jgi:hypothetical protein